MKKAILILAANPQGDIRIDREIRDLQKAIERNKNSEQFEVKIALAVRPEDLQELLYENKPYIVHFCGHGAGEQGLVFESNTEGKQLVSNQALSGLFKIFKDNVECVLLNACHTEAQADVIVEHVEYVIGTSREILDKAAYFFAVGFYKALVREKSIETCYEWGCNTVQLSMPKVNIVPHSSERFRKMEVIEEDGSKVVSEPLKIVLKQQSNLEKQLVKTNFSQSVGNSNLSPDIPPDFRQEIAQEGNIKQYKNTTRKTIKELGQSPLIKRETISRNEYRQRKTLLNKVKEFWIEGFLKHSLYANTAINLDLKSRPDEVLRPFEGLEEITVELDDSFEELQPTDILRQTGQGKTLLILGDPGSGKTITLLQLAQKLVNQTEQDLTKPIPVVFNLSSWGQKQQTIDKWLIEEFKDKYQVPQTWSERWLEQQQLILLLDGLDEVRGEQRNACVKALN
ncbi:MAG: NACHT domain-containing protein, partial [Xenococcus sp. (in: cyanobacteria)]